MKTKTAVSLSLFLIAPLALTAVLTAATPPARAQAQAQNLTLSGAIVGSRNANEIWLRSYDRYYRVAGKAPFAITNGDRVRVAGAWKNGVLTGSNWKKIAAVGPVVKANFSVDGAVYRDLPGDEFQLKSLGGAIYRVLSVKPSPAGLSRGDLVSVIGKRDKGVILATSVIITQQREAIGNAPDYRPHRAVIGTVASDPNGNIFALKTGGRTDRVLALYGENSAVKSGARVRLWAFWDNEQGLWQASNVRVLNGNASGIGARPNVDKAYGPQFQPRVLSGTIVAGGGAKWTIQSNGAKHPIQLLVARPGLFSVGSKVKLTGSWRAGTMRVSKIEMR